MELVPCPGWCAPSGSLPRSLRSLHIHSHQPFPIWQRRANEATPPRGPGAAGDACMLPSGLVALQVRKPQALSSPAALGPRAGC